MYAKERSLILLVAVLLMLIDISSSVCPARIFVTRSPNRTPSSQPGGLSDVCCPEGGSCGCRSGLQCCANVRRQRVCVEDPCQPNPCGKGVCLTTANGKGVCLCPAGFIKNSKGACVDNPCHPNPCRSGACSPVVAPDSVTHTCSCRTGFEFNGKICVRSNEQSAPPADPCDGFRCPNGRCVSSRNRARCVCNRGFRLVDGSCQSTRRAQNRRQNDNTENTGGVRCNPARTRSTEDLGDSGRSRILQGTATGCIKSRNYPRPFSENILDEVVIPTRGFKTLRITLHDFQMTSEDEEFSRNNCDNDFFFASGQLFCGNADDTRVINIDIKGRRQVVVGLVSDEDGNTAKGFLARWDLL